MQLSWWQNCTLDGSSDSESEGHDTSKKSTELFDSDNGSDSDTSERNPFDDEDKSSGSEDEEGKRYLFLFK